MEQSQISTYSLECCKQEAWNELGTCALLLSSWCILLLKYTTMSLKSLSLNFSLLQCCSCTKLKGNSATVTDFKTVKVYGKEDYRIRNADCIQGCAHVMENPVSFSSLLHSPHFLGCIFVIHIKPVSSRCWSFCVNWLFLVTLFYRFY